MALGTLAGKYGRVNVLGVPINGSFRWAMSFRRERLDVTNFESTVSNTGYNVFSDGLTGVLDTTANIEGYFNTAAPNLFYPDGPLTFDFLFAKSPQFGYFNVYCDILEYSPGVTVRDRQQFTASLQTSGSVPTAA